MARRQHLTLTFVLVLVAFCTLSYMFSGPTSTVMPAFQKNGVTDREQSPLKEEGQKADFAVDINNIPDGLLDGESIAPKLENATLKAELGHATWKFLHTMMSRFPDNPSKEDRQALDTFMHLFGRLYPCGQCAKHFRGLLAEYPPQTSSRNAAAGWLCYMHNLVNERVHKPVFDCSKIGDFYDCGCGDDKKKKEGTEGADETKTVGGSEEPKKGVESAHPEEPDQELHKH